MRTIHHILLAGLVCMSSVAMAQQNKGPVTYRYSWKDDSGQPHFSDSLNAQAIKNGYDVINSSGMVVRHVQRTMTPQERKIADAAKARKDAARAARNRQLAEDQQMLAAYPNERVFRDAQEAEVDELTQSVRTTEVNLHTQEQNLADLLAHVADLKHQGQPVPKYLQDRIAEQRANVTEQRHTLARQKANKLAEQKQVEQRIKHYHELREKALSGN